MDHKVGGMIDGWCTRCKLVLRHTIEAIAKGKISRVHCNTCGGQHAHRKGAPTPRTTKAGPREARPAEKRPSQYEYLLRDKNKESARSYSTTARFAVGDLVSHATFGLGVVTGERDTVKIDVVFADGPRVLMHGR